MLLSKHFSTKKPTKNLPESARSIFSNDHPLFYFILLPFDGVFHCCGFRWKKHPVIYRARRPDGPSLGTSDVRTTRRRATHLLPMRIGRVATALYEQPTRDDIEPYPEIREESVNLVKLREGETVCQETLAT